MTSGITTYERGRDPDFHKRQLHVTAPTHASVSFILDTPHFRVFLCLRFLFPLITECGVACGDKENEGSRSRTPPRTRIAWKKEAARTVRARGSRREGSDRGRTAEIPHAMGGEREPNRRQQGRRERQRIRRPRSLARRGQHRASRRRKRRGGVPQGTVLRPLLLFPYYPLG